MEQLADITNTLDGFDIQRAPCGVFLFDESLLLRSGNQTLADMLGVDRNALVGMPLDQLWSPAMRLGFHIRVMALLHLQGYVEEIALIMRAADGSEIPVLLNAVRRLHGGIGITECVVIRMRERKRLEDELFRVKKATEQMPGAIYQFVLDADGRSRFPYASEGIRELYEVSPMQLRRDAGLVFQRIHPDDLDEVNHSVRISALALSPWNQQYRVNLPRQGLRWLEGRAIPEARADDSVLWHGYLVDITERKALEIVQAIEHERTRVTLRSIGDAVITTDRFGLVEYLNPVAESLTGWGCIEAIGLPVDQVFCIVHQHSRAVAGNPVARCLAEGAITGATPDALLIARQGAEYAVEDSAAPIFGADRLVSGAVMVFRDVTPQRKLHQEAEHRSRHDHLTGLPNRREFEHLLEQLFVSARTEDVEHALCFIDLDRFKAVNDSCGHAAGDVLLKKVADLLRQCVRATDKVARLGGDEFAVLLQKCDLTTARRIAQDICDRMAAMRFLFDGKQFDVGASIGVVLLDGSWSSISQAQQAADQACFAAKAAGRGQVHIGAGSGQPGAAPEAPMPWSIVLQQALDNDRFVLFAQPVVALGEGGGRHVEVLLRLKDDSDGLILPGAYLPAAERCGLAVRIDRWVLAQTCQWLGSASGQAVESVAINISGASVVDPAFHQFVGETLNRMPVAKLFFEISESVAIEHPIQSQVFFEVMHRIGAQVGLDDVGRGLTSMAYLKRLQVDYLKIDGQIVTSMATDAVNGAMVRSINEIGHLLGIRTVAEGVESEAVLQMLRVMGVDYAQGYHSGKPKPIG
ncbi:EAL domain-containing protein [Actimicrobium sp. CCC2.4]|uniref:bifunctional diguanylate cyclase/phosphodiesterase n=1 Tax=Actimicrobium sp. CCC2.4 TaxID=3048606 RepID=UPI002AC9342B|nr:EAL domain-containing protein [Actimicrobium sp. CCC2.4]MEB0134222.1 EAL domain-containing protein [Actimicrobium sp. CCC2.4]WPX32872.1 EAL domain-containing protein [Actimicrobium sp. CCC2.4]